MGDNLEWCCTRWYVGGFQTPPVSPELHQVREWKCVRDIEVDTSPCSKRFRRITQRWWLSWGEVKCWRSGWWGLGPAGKGEILKTHMEERSATRKQAKGESRKTVSTIHLQNYVFLTLLLRQRARQCENMIVLRFVLLCLKITLVCSLSWFGS